MSHAKIVLMACGCFSPPTFMHLRMFEIAKDYINALGNGTVIGGIISPVHDAYKKKDLVASNHRLSMLKLALKSSSWVKVSDWECNQQGWTKTRISLNYHQETLNNHYNYEIEDPPSWLPDDIINVNSNIDRTDNIQNGTSNIKVMLLCGADLLESFATPGLWSDDDMEAIVGRHGLVVVTRSGCDPGKFIYDSDMLHKHRNNITLITNYIANDVSSTVIRRCLRRSESAKYLTDDAVISYIMQNGLYGVKRVDTEYDILNDIIAPYEKKSPIDISMSSPEETTIKHILINLRDKPTITDETIVVKRQKKSYFTKNATVNPVGEIKPKVAFEKRTPGKAVKLPDNEVSDGSVKVDKSVKFDDSVKVDEKARVKSVSFDSNLEECISVVKSQSVDELSGAVSNVNLTDMSYKTRSCNEIVKLVLTKHGIHVISDCEAIL